jgi:hypothetical protein
MTDIVRACVLWQEPLIVYTTPLDKAFSFSSQFAHDFADRTTIILPLIAWSAELHSSALAIAQSSLAHEARFPLHQVWNMCNTEAEVLALQNLGARAYFMNHNVFVDYNSYVVRQHVKKIYSAIYNAQISEFKRHWLCAKLDDVAFLYHSGGPTLNSDARKYFDFIGKSVPGAHFLNELKDPALHPGLTRNEVCNALNQAFVGLCLSDVEGAMHASIEYLFCGIPIVSTRSRGGRDLFFDEEYCVLTEAHPDAVAAGVKRLIRDPIDPNRIRLKTIARVEQHRERFVAFIERLLVTHGVEARFAEAWKNVYFDKLLTWESKEEFRKRLRVFNVKGASGSSHDENV